MLKEFRERFSYHFQGSRRGQAGCKEDRQREVAGSQGGPEGMEGPARVKFKERREELEWRFGSGVATYEVSKACPRAGKEP